MTKWYISKITGNKYLYTEYINHGRREVYKGYKDLPHDEYPYGIIELRN